MTSRPPCFYHGRVICSDRKCYQPDDTARRAYDVIHAVMRNLDYETRTRGYPYVALRLSDGGSDGRSYDTRRAAIKAQFHEQQCCYFSFRDAPMGFASPLEAGLYIEFHRYAYEQGMRLADPDDRHGGPELIVPSMREHFQNQLTRLAAPRSLN